MPRIFNFNRIPDPSTQAEETERAQQSQMNEEQQAALAEETSFFAAAAFSDEELRPQLRALRREVPQLGAMRAREAIARGCNPYVLEGASMTTLRSTYAWFHEHLPQTPLGHDLELAWAGGIERFLASMRYSLEKIGESARELAEGRSDAPTFFATWDHECAALRAASNEQLRILEPHTVGADGQVQPQKGAPGAPHESFFYHQLLAALDEFAQPIGIAKAKQEAPSTQLLQTLINRLQQTSAFSQIEKYGV